MTSSAPSSIFLRPIFQASATRIEYCSMVSGCVVGTIRTAIWLPLRCSKLLMRWFSVSMVSLVSVLVRSTTRPLSCGTSTSASAACAKHRRSASRTVLIVFTLIAPSLIGLLRRRRVEVHLGRGRDFLLVVDGEVRLLLVAEHHRRQIVREGADADIIVLHRLDVAVARHGDAILGAFELRHQIAEQRVRFELRVILGHDQ